MTKRVILVYIFLIMSFLSGPASASEVYYLGGAGGPGMVQNPSYPFSQRINDLMDLTSARPIAERSGRISGSVLTQGVYNKVSGNRSKSFLHERGSYLSEINLNIQEKLPSDYNLEGQIMLRKTDDPRIEVRRDLRMKQFSMKVLNPDNIYQAGDLYAELSQYTLGASLEGFSGENKVSDLLTMKYVAARKTTASEVESVFQRNVVGAKSDFSLFRNSEIFSNARVGFQAVTSQDDSSTAERTGTGFSDLRNTVISTDGSFSWVKHLAVDYELARSFYLADEDSATIKDQSSGNALRVAPQLTFGSTTVRYLYSYVQPEFYTDSGSASPDMIQHQATVDHRFSKRLSASFMENYYWDHLTNSTRTKRTINNDKSLTVNFLPFAARESFRARVNMGYNLRSSDDIGNTLEGRTITIGTGFNDRINEKTDWGLSYEYRAFTDLAAKSTSDYTNRFGASLGREQMLFARRLYFSLNPSIDIRRTKTDDNKDLNIGVGLSGQYDMAKGFLARFGHTLADTNAAKAGADHTNNNSYLEFDKSFGEKADRHLVLRGERNRYVYEDGDQNYAETRAIIKYIFSF